MSLFTSRHPSVNRRDVNLSQFTLFIAVCGQSLQRLLQVSNRCSTSYQSKHLRDRRLGRRRL